MATKKPHLKKTVTAAQEFTFTNVQLLKNETVGTGSYGAVCKAKCDQLICAAKLIWPALLQLQAPDPGKEHRQPFRRFESECQFLSRINHPNIVQYLGTYHDPETNAPVLLMELMDESLTHYLESSPRDIPYHIQVNFASDIAQALAFLHANGIIHRDLSSNNVLLIAGHRAKVTDFGMLKFTQLNATRLATMTSVPGTPAFMSPEALNEPPVYTEKLDNFSFGVLLVQIGTRQFPKPSNRFKVLRIPDPQNPMRTLEAQVAIPEVERRHADIGLIEPTHPLLSIALPCLRDSDVERPSSQQLCQSLDTLKKMTRYKESSQQDIGQLLRAKEEQIRAKDEELHVSMADNNHLTRENLILRNETETLKSDNQALQSETEAKERQLRRLRQQLEEITSTFQETIAQRDREISKLRGMPTTKTEEVQDLSSHLHEVSIQEKQAKHATEKCINVVWESLLNTPDAMNAGSSTVIDDKAYFRSHSSTTIYEFNPCTKHWSSLPALPLHDFTIVGIDNMLTTVGGFSRSRFNCSDKLYTYINRKWVEHFPPMPTKRQTPAVLYTTKTVVVVGGQDSTSFLTTVEILSTQRRQWSCVSSLPFTTSQPSATMCGGCIYLHAGTSSRQEWCSVLKCSLNVLVKSMPSSSVWERISPLPAHYSSLAIVNTHLLAVSGEDSKRKYAKDIHKYNPTTNSWQVVSQLSIGRSRCLSASLPGNKLMVVGGVGAYWSAEMATLHFD